MHHAKTLRGLVKHTLIVFNRGVVYGTKHCSMPLILREKLVKFFFLLADVKAYAEDLQLLSKLIWRVKAFSIAFFIFCCKAAARDL